VVDVPAESQLSKRGARLVSFIGRQHWLDRPSYRFEHLVGIAFNSLGRARDRVANALHGVWLGHPVHPPLASLTSGAMGTTVALDALSLLPGRPKSEVVEASRFASRALGLGIMANLGSAVTGVADWQHTHEEDRRIRLVHGIVNSLATGLYIMSWLDRHRGGTAGASSPARSGTASRSEPATWVGLWCSSRALASITPASGSATRTGRLCCRWRHCLTGGRSASRSTGWAWCCVEPATTRR
jgi:hypothetical protein